MLLGGVYALFVSFAFFFFTLPKSSHNEIPGVLKFFFILRQDLILSPLPEFKTHTYPSEQNTRPFTQSHFPSHFTLGMTCQLR